MSAGVHLRRALAAAGLTLLAGVVHAERHALLVGVSSYPSLEARLQLEGPRNDIPLIRSVLLRRGFDAARITTLADGVEGAADPTRAAILGALDALVGRAAAGDYVYLHFAGHGSQQPVVRGSAMARSEPDGLHEIFLPRDIGSWNDKAGTVLNAIVDHELTARLDALLGKGAFVFAVFDACHSATLMRGVDDEVRYRQVSPSALGIGAQAIDEAIAGAKHTAGIGGKPPDAKLPMTEPAPAAGRGGFVAFYAAQTTETTPEMRLPAGHPQRRSYGLFGFTLAEAMGAVDGVSYRQLGEHVLQRYAAQNVTSPTPLFTGTHLDAPLFGSRAGSPLRQWPIDNGKGLSIPAGALSRLGEGELLAVVASPLAGAGEVLGHVRIDKLEPLSAMLTPVAHEGRAALAASAIPAGAHARQIAPALNLELRVALLGGQAGARVRELIDTALAGEPARGVRVRWVAAGQDADLRLVADDGQLWLVGAGAQLVPKGAAKTPSIRIEQKEFPALLADTLQRIGKALNLLRIASQLQGMAEARRLDVQVQLRRRDGSRQPMPALPQLADGDVVELTLRNTGRQPLDLTALYVDGDWGIGVLYPVQAGASNRIEAGGSDTLTLTVNDDTTGVERLLLIAVEARAGADRYDFSFMAQARLERTRAADAGDPITAVFTAAGFGEDESLRTRGAKPALPGRTEMRLLQWRVVGR